MKNSRQRRQRRYASMGVATAATLALALLLPTTAAASVTGSDQFDHWSPGVKTADVTYTASAETKHEGSYSLKIVNTTAKPTGKYGTFQQTVPVQPNTRYDFTSWIKADGVGTQGLQVVLSPTEDNWKIRANFPPGTYDWREYDWSYTTTATQSSFVYRILTHGAETAWLDSLTMVKHGTTANLLANSGFEDNSVAAQELRITSPRLLLDEGKATISLGSTHSSLPVHWDVTDDQHQSVSSGDVSMQDGSASIDLRHLGPGYYNLEVTATANGRTLTRKTDFGVLGPKSDAVGGKDSPFGVSTHFWSGWNPNLMAVMHEVGFGQFRDEGGWAKVEKSPGVYHTPQRLDTYMTRAAEEGLNPLFVADYSNPLYDGGKTPSTPEGIDAFAKYAAAVVDHYPNLTDVEVYNEFNGRFNTGSCGRTPQCYFPLLKATYQQVKAADPDATVVGPATASMSTSWIEDLIDLGGLKYLDAITTHPYRYPGPPESLAADLAQLRSYIRAHNDGKDVPIWFTEIGWPTHTGGSGVSESTQADYLIRSEVISLENGVTRFYWYDLLNDGNDPTSSEENFGLLRRPTTTVVGSAPKPGIVSQATLIRALAGLKPTGKDDLGNDIWSYRFGTGSDLTRVLWATTPTGVDISTSEPITVTDRYGKTTTLKPTGGTVQLGLDGHPVILRGPVQSIAQTTLPTFGIAPASSAVVGDPVSVTLRVDRTGHQVVPTPKTTVFTIDGKDYPVRTRPHRVTTRTIQLPPSTTTGKRVVTATVHAANRSAQVRTVVTVTPATTIRVVPHTTGTTPVSGNVSVDVTNNRSAPAAFTNVSWTVGDTSGQADVGTIAAHDTSSTTVKLDSVTPWDPVSYTATATPSEGPSVTISGTTGLNPIEQDGSDTVPPIDLETQGVPTYKARPYGGPSDLSGTVSLAYTEQDLVVHARITDNALSQVNDAARMWAGDSIQMAVSDGLPGSTGAETEFGFAKLTSGPAFYSWRNATGAPAGPTEGANGAITRDGTVTAYDVAIPWTSLGFDHRPAGPIAMSFVVNDSDNGTRDGWVAWGSGIATKKSSSLFRPMVFLP